MGCDWSRPSDKRAKQYQLPEPAAEAYSSVRDHEIDRTRQLLLRLKRAKRPGTQYSPTKDQPAPRSSDGTPSPATNPTPPAVKDTAKLDPKDFSFTGLRSETRVKLPGSVQGQQFIIDSCKDCNLFVLDHCASVTIDDCTNCRIFIGPTEASVFLRDCSNCSLACITRQLRCRDCHHCSLLLHCRTLPIIEKSSSMAFGCYNTPYAGLAAQMAAAQLSPFHNFWSDVYDFTPADARAAHKSMPVVAAAVGHGQIHYNWKLLPASASVRQLLGDPDLPPDVLALTGLPAAAAASASAADAGVVAVDVVDATLGAKAAAAETTSAPAAAAAAQASLAAQAGASALITDADCMCVMYTQGLQQKVAVCCTCERCADASSTCNNSSNGSGGGVKAEDDVLFVLFPAAHRQAALQWVFSQQLNGQQQQQQLLQPLPGTQQAAAGASMPVLLHTNEASIPAAVLQQLAAAAGWSKAELKRLVGASAAAAAGKGAKKAPAAACVGLEVSCCGCADETNKLLQLTAKGAGALCCTSASAATLFREQGMHG